MARGTMDRRQTPAMRAPSTRAPSYRLTLDARTAWDFLISATIGDGASYDLEPQDREWLGRARDALGEEQRTTLDRGFGSKEPNVFHGLPIVVAQDPEVRTAADVVALLATMDPSRMVRAMLTECLTDDVAPDVLDRAVTGDATAIDTLDPHVGEPDVTEAVRRFFADPERNLERGLVIARSWMRSFQEIEPRLARIHAADVALRQEDVAALSPDEAIERVTGGLRFLPDARVRRVILGPSVFTRPFNHVYQGADWRLFCYPVADGVLGSDTGTPSASLIRLFRALGDPTRLQVLRLLTDREWYLTELATQLGLSKPTMKHHLALLRAAGLVTVIEEGGLTYYSLRRERIEEGGVELRRYLA